MDAAGVVGVRLNLVNFDLEAALSPALPAFLRRLAERGWWLELQCRAPVFPRIAPVLEESGVRVLFDHLGCPDVSLGPHEPGFRALCAFAGRGEAAMKLSGAFRLSRRAHPHEDVAPFAAAAVEAFGQERCVWGSDYPFLWTGSPPAYADTLALLERWVPDPADRDVILRQAPARLFGLGAPRGGGAG
jgi:predicted TIM-barrel fold metal-dependent hydrolase